MKRIYFILVSIFLFNQAFGQNIAFMKMGDYYPCEYLDNAIISKIKESNPNVKSFNNTNLFLRYNNKISELNNDQKENLKMFNYDYIILHKSEKNNQDIYQISNSIDLDYKISSQSEFIIINVNNNKSAILKLVISTFDCGNKLETCSNIEGFVKSIKDFVQVSNSNNSTNEEELNNSIKLSEVAKPEVNVKKKKSFSSNSNYEGKFKLVRVKERNASTNTPILVDVYDKNQLLNVGDNIIITRTDEVKIPGERKSIKSETTIGKARITEAFNKPLFTAKLIGNAGSNMKDYKDGAENYSALKGVENITNVATPKIMVIPKKIDASKFLNGEYQLSKSEKMLIAAFKNKFEDNKFTTFGFESAIKNIFEQRQFQDNTQEDIKSKILESAGMDFYVEYENLDQSNNNCEKVFDFKIRNYSTGEDVASDLKSLNICGSPDDFKVFAASILSSGAISKINKQFSSLVENGKKISVVFTFANSSSASFDKEFNGVKLGVHIENCLQELSLNGNLDIEGVVNLRMETTVNIPVIDANNGKSYTTYMFSENIIEYLKKNAGVTCKSSVSKQIVNIIIQ